MNMNHANDEDRIAGSAPMESSVSVSSEDTDQMNKSSIATGHEYWNLTNEQVLMRDRYGMTVIIEPTNLKDRKPTARKFIIFEHLMVGDGCTFDMSGVRLGDNIDKSDERIAQLKQSDFEAWTESRRVRGARSTDTKRMRYKTVIENDDLREGVYVPSIDRVLYLASAKRIYHHPESVVGKLLRKQKSDNQSFGFNLNVEIFDNGQLITDRWIRQGKFSFKVPVNRDGLEPNGVRITCMSSGGRLSSETYPLEEADEQIGLFKSKEDADAWSLESEANKRNLELEKELEELKNKTQRENAENKRKEQYYEREKAERTHDNFREKSDTEQQQFREKAKYETESLHRKNALDALKFIPAVITAVTGLILVFDKLKKKS